MPAARGRRLRGIFGACYRVFMSLHLRTLLIASLSLLACSEDRADAPGPGATDDTPTPEPDGRHGDKRDRRPEPVMSPACDALIDAGESLYDSPGFFASVDDARASAEGHVLLLLSEKEAADAPLETVLRLVRSPAGPQDVRIALPDQVLALGEIRDGKLLVAHGGSEVFGPVQVSQIDLAARSVAGTHPVEDLSERPRPQYDASGAATGESTGRALAVVRQRASLGALHIAQLPDGGHALLGFASDPLPSQGYAIGLWLFVFEADGRFRARTLIKPVLSGFLGGVQLAADASGRLHVLTGLHESERAAFSQIHGRTLQTSAFENLPLVLTLSASGALETVHEADIADCSAPLIELAGGLDVSDDAVTWTGTCGAGHFVASASPSSAATTVTKVMLGDAQAVTSVLRGADGSLFVGGTRGFMQAPTGSLVAPGEAVLARFDASGVVDPVCPYDSERQDRYLLRRTGKPLLILNYDQGLTHAEGDDTRGSARVRYFAPPTAP